MGGGQMTPGDAASVAPLFTDFTSSNLGLPKNVAIPYDYETTPDSFGFKPRRGEVLWDIFCLSANGRAGR